MFMIPIAINLHYFQKHKQGLNWTIAGTLILIENTGKIVTALRLGQRQGCKKHLNFIPGIVTAFQSGLGQN